MRSTPTWEGSTLSKAVPYIVKRIIGVRGRSCRSLGAVCKPFMTGIDRSRIIMSGLIRSATAIPSSPSPASAHVVKPSDKKAFTTAFRISGLSSTIRTVFPSPDFFAARLTASIGLLLTAKAVPDAVLSFQLTARVKLLLSVRYAACIGGTLYPHLLLLRVFPEFQRQIAWPDRRQRIGIEGRMAIGSIDLMRTTVQWFGVP